MLSPRFRAVSSNTTACAGLRNGFVTKDSGVREEYASGMRRDTQEGKARLTC